MAKKPKPRRPTSTPTRRAVTSSVPRRWWQHQAVWGSGVLLLVIGIGVWVRYSLFRPVLPQLPGMIGQHYVRGPATAPVVLKEFSDYT